MNANQARTHDLISEHDRKASEMAMRWYGWGSPVGLGLFLVAIGVTVMLVSRAIGG